MGSTSEPGGSHFAPLLAHKFVCPWMNGVRVSITDRIRDYVRGLEKYKAVQKKFSCEEIIEIKRIVNFSVILFLQLMLLWIFEVQTYYQRLESIITVHSSSF